MIITLSARMTVPLSIIMLGFVYAILKPGPHVMIARDAPVFTTFRDYQGETFLSRRTEVAYIHYSLLHAIPAGIWSIVMPLQYWDYMRRRSPKAHRLCGYMAFTCSSILAITGIAFIPRKLSWSNPTFKLHEVYGYPLIPSFNLGLIAVAFPAMVITGTRAFYLAYKRRFSEHRKWATYHGISGYLISLERVYLLVSSALGKALQSSKSLQQIMGTDRIKTLIEKSDAERAVFAWAMWAAILSAAMWYHYVKQSNVSLIQTQTKSKT